MSTIKAIISSNCFIKIDEYKRFLELFSSYVLPYADVLAWCLIPNHYHFMLSVKENCVPLKQGNIMLDSVSNGFRKLTGAYAHAYNKAHQKSGSVFRPKTKSKNLTDDKNAMSYLNCFYYVHQNAWRHGIVSNVSLWKYSSYDFYAGTRKQSICNMDRARQLCEFDSATFIKLTEQRVPDELVASFFES